MAVSFPTPSPHQTTQGNRGREGHRERSGPLAEPHWLKQSQLSPAVIRTHAHNTHPHTKDVFASRCDSLIHFNLLFCSIWLNYQFEYSATFYYYYFFFYQGRQWAFLLWLLALLTVPCSRRKTGGQRLEINYWWEDGRVLSLSLCSNFVIIWRRWAGLALILLIQLLPRQG